MSDTAKMDTLCDFTTGRDNTAARIDCPAEGITFIIKDPFAVYLAQKKNDELRAFLEEKSLEIKRFIEKIEKRVTTKSKELF